MTTRSLSTYMVKSASVGQIFFGPILANPIAAGQGFINLYAFLSHVEPWPDEYNPDVPTQDQQTIKSVWKKMFVAKSITQNNISPVIPRINWTSGVVYNYYTDSIDVLALDASGYMIKNFYVKNRYDQVFKCLWNNNGSQSTVEPLIQPGTYGTNNIYQGSDGYKWKYVYTINLQLKRTFMDNDWMPVPYYPNDVVSSAGLELQGIIVPGLGDVEVVNVLNGGSGYYAANTTVLISGDGTITATAEPIIQSGVITDVVVTNPGLMYSRATATVVSSSGSGAILTSPVSPVGGHCYDPVTELGCNHVMVVAEFNGTEGGNLPVVSGIGNIPIDYRQVGVIVNPIAKDTYPFYANESIYSLTTNITVDGGLGDYYADDTIYQKDAAGNIVFSATIFSFDISQNIIRVINTSGEPVLGSPVYGTTSSATRTAFSVDYPKLMPYTGDILYIENRTSITRSSDGIDQLKFVLGY